MMSEALMILTGVLVIGVSGGLIALVIDVWLRKK